MDKCTSINETSRKYPPISVRTRECTKSYKVPGTNLTLKKASAVFVPVLGIQSEPEYHAEPDKFDPKRFSPENNAKRHSAACIPFGDGSCACIGLRFGIMQTKFGLTTLLKYFRVTTYQKTKVPLQVNPQNFILSVREGVWLEAERI
ncbi:hypothetical protein ILUMI_09486 [Ignelater luminosus]|uniref:Cytochrome P450 n=1 Tax=Ignelater luminosus TaxID=2038154 RepID=A0A8K0D2A3_IGNLU|nr:hypothetical protein ILUMI_09486 [Ignelater luminosus]